MTKGITKLRDAALDSNLRVEDLLRLALATGLQSGDREFVNWTNLELNGYPSQNIKDYPAYRIIHGSVKAFNPYRGWQPVFFQSNKDLEALSKKAINSSVATLSSQLSEGTSRAFMADYDSETLLTFHKAMKIDFDVKLFIDRGAIAGIIDAARTRVLEWAMAQQEDTPAIEAPHADEKQQPPAGIVISHIENFSAGQVGQVRDVATLSNMQKIGITPQTVGQIASIVFDLYAEAQKAPQSAQRDELLAILRNLQHEVTDQQRPSVFVKVLDSIKSVAENALGSAIAQLYTPRIAEILSYLAKLG